MTPSTTQVRDALPRRGCRDENVVAACNAIKEWLSSSPATKSARVSCEKPSPEMTRKVETPSPKIGCKTPEKESEKPSKLTTQGLINPSLASFSIDDQSGPSTRDPFPDQDEEADIAPEANSEAGQDSASTSPCTENEKVQLDIDAHSAGNGSARNGNGHVENDGTPGLFNLKNCPVGRWLEDISEPSNTCTVDDAVNNFTRDIDIDNGNLLPEIQHPMTLQSRSRGPCRDSRDMAWRQANMTAELQIRREMGSRERLAVAIECHQQASKASEAAVVFAEEEAPWSKADCTVRPVRSRDFQQIADIMNLEREAKDCPQIIQPKMIQISDINMIYESCQRAMQPFIVATACENELLDRSKWPKNANRAYQEYLRYVKSSRAKSARREPVYGFAFLRDARLGFLQDSSSASSFSSQLKMAVHPRHRRRLYGSALLDRILLTIGPYYKSQLDYHWTCPVPDHVYEQFAGHNRRQYNSMYLETLCISRNDTEHAWQRAFLDKFGFREVAFFPNAAKTDHDHNSKWLALLLWAVDIQPASQLTDRPLEI